MPIKTVKKAAKSTAQTIRKHWSKDEADRRRTQAALMQQRLIDVLGLRPASPR